MIMKYLLNSLNTSFIIFIIKKLAKIKEKKQILKRFVQFVFDLYIAKLIFC